MTDLIGWRRARDLRRQLLRAELGETLHQERADDYERVLKRIATMEVYDYSDGARAMARRALNEAGVPLDG